MIRHRLDPFRRWRRSAPPPDPDIAEAQRVQAIKREGSRARRRQAEPIVAAGRRIWEHNHLAEALVAAAHRIVEGDQ